MEFIDEQLSAYSERFTSSESQILEELNRFTYSKVLMPRMLSGHLQGRFLSMMSKMINPKCILEIGTYTGYSAICLAEGLNSDGKLITIEVNEEYEDLIRSFIKKAGFENKIELWIGNAKELIGKIEQPIDLVFIDADKENYSNYLDLVKNKLRSGGYIIADNVLWSAKVLQKESEMDSETKALHHFNIKIAEDPDFETVLLPVRDGLMIARKV
ncbi:MAG TPA: O-methyltransferase [Bacteroidia bacterium]|nr:O-methyltransferase [Bacteroidia bacterium]